MPSIKSEKAGTGADIQVPLGTTPPSLTMTRGVNGDTARRHAVSRRQPGAVAQVLEGPHSRFAVLSSIFERHVL